MAFFGPELGGPLAATVSGSERGRDGDATAQAQAARLAQRVMADATTKEGSESLSWLIDRIDTELVGVERAIMRMMPSGAVNVSLDAERLVTQQTIGQALQLALRRVSLLHEQAASVARALGTSL